jgi:hypothetical protein
MARGIIEMKKSVRIVRLGKTATIYTITFAALIFAASVGSFVSSGTLTKAEQSPADRISSDLPLRLDRLSFALDLRAAHREKTFSGDEVASQGDGREAKNELSAGRALREDVERSLKITKQLDCTQLVDPDLTNKTITPGVYCLPSLRLSGPMTLDAMGNEAALFVFVVKGAMRIEGGATTLQHGVDAANVFFAVDDEVKIASGVSVAGNIIARGSISVGAGAEVKGRTLSSDGKVTVDGESAAGAGTGILEICKQQQGTGLENRIFRFEVAGIVYQAPVGGCTGPIELPVGNVVITELDRGTYMNQSGEWVNRFKLVNVNSPTPNALQTVNLPARRATVFIREGSVQNLTVVNFVNAFAIVGTLEICKRSLDVDVTGFFDYTVDAIPNTTFTVPVGYCTGPISVLTRTLPQSAPATGPARVTELADPSFQLESVSTFPASRLQNYLANLGITNSIGCSNIGPDPIPPACLFSNEGGGIAEAIVEEGGVPNQTVINFFNRSRPGRVKVCKIAGPGIPIGAIFRFRVQGTGPSNLFPGSQMPGVAIDTTVDVVAGPAYQGGFCNFVNALFVIGTPVTVTELLPTITPVPGVPPGDIRVSRIRVEPGPSTTNYATRTATTVARRETIEIEFTNFVFRPTVLKICKVAGEGVAIGTPFTFTIRIDNESGLFAPASTLAVPNLTLPAGPAAQGGFCAFAQGPYDLTATNPPVGTFRVGSTVYVTEGVAAGTVVQSISSPSGQDVKPCVPADARCGGIVLAFPDGFNELTFTNIKAPVAQRAPFDFDGDGKTDISVTRHSGSSRWYQLRSGDGYTFTQFDLGQTGDLVVPADYNGDGKTEAGVFRPSTGDWWVLNEGESVAVAMNAGMVGDIPLPSDYTGDGKADFVLYRPSTGQWFRYENGSTNTSHMAFGMAGDKPLIGDFDGDGKADPAIFRSSTGTFWYAASSEGNAHRAAQWGMNGDTAVTGDYDGDGKTDLAVFRPSNGTWWILNSSTGQMTGLQWGMNGDKPIAADYDGDGKADVAVYRPSNGTWYIIKSGSGFQGFVWGVSTDIPTPGAYIQ